MARYRIEEREYFPHAEEEVTLAPGARILDAEYRSANRVVCAVAVPLCGEATTSGDPCSRDVEAPHRACHDHEPEYDWEELE